MNTGDKLKQLRTNKGLTLEQLAEIFSNRHNSNIHKSMLSNWENNKVKPTIDSLAMYSNYFNVSLDWIIGISNNSNLLDAYMIKSTAGKGVIKEIKSFLYDIIMKQQEKVYELIKENNLALDFDDFTVDSDFESFIIYSDLLEIDISKYNPDLLELLDLMSDDILIQSKQKELLKITTKINSIKELEELIKIAEIKLL